MDKVCKCGCNGSQFWVDIQGIIAGCLVDMCNGDDILHRHFSILIHKVCVQDVKLQYPQYGDFP